MSNIEKNYPEALVGQTLVTFEVAKDRKAIRLVTSSGAEIIVGVDGDCCSSSWIEHVSNPEAAIGSPLLRAEDLQLNRPDEEVDYAVVKFYGFVLETVKGTCTIDYRNSSNGYYGGNLSWPSPDYRSHYGGVFGQNNSAYEWEPAVER